MTPLLAPLVGDAPTITIIGLCKNAGKTTAMCRLIEELSGEVLAMTSVGRDGERTDVVTGTEKPEIWVPEGTLFATARGMLPLCDTTLQVEGVTDVMTPLGAVGFSGRSAMDLSSWPVLPLSTNWRRCPIPSAPWGPGGSSSMGLRGENPWRVRSPAPVLFCAWGHPWMAVSPPSPPRPPIPAGFLPHRRRSTRGCGRP